MAANVGSYQLGQSLWICKQLVGGNHDTFQFGLRHRDEKYVEPTKPIRGS
jgi:hypothetical protein